MVKFYELAYLMSPLISEAQIISLNEEIKNYIAKEGGKIEKETPATKVRLGYPIKKFEEGFLFSLDILFEGQKTKDLENEIKQKADIIRHIIFQKTQKKPTAPRKPRTPASKTKPQKVELKDLDKKLEEILK